MALVLFGNNGFSGLISAWRERRKLQRELVQLRLEHEQLAQELERIHQDPAYTEYLIRKNLGYVKKGEYEYRVLKTDSRQK